MYQLRKSLREKYFDIAFTVLLLLLTLPALLYLKRFTQFPFPMEYREASSILAAAQFHAGLNPYLPEYFPEQMYSYGLIFPMGIAALWNFLPFSFLIPRLINMAALAFSALALFGILRCQRASLVGSLTSGIIFLYAMCVVLKINGARPDIVAMAFCLAGLYASTASNFSWKGLITACICWLMAFYLKQYMVFPVALVCTYIFFFRSKSRGVVLATIFFVLLLCSGIVVKAQFPLYFRYAIMHQWNNIFLERDHMVVQLSYFLEWFAILCVGYLVVVHAKYFVDIKRKFEAARIYLKGFREPLFGGTPIEFWDFSLVLIILVLIFYMGQDTGNIHVYFLELLLPFLLIAVLPTVESFFPRRLYRGLAYAALLTCLIPLANNFKTDFPAYVKGFRALDKRLNNCQNIYGSPLIAVYLKERGMPTIYDNGASEWGYEIIGGNNSPMQFLLGGNDKLLAAKWAEWNTGIQTKVQSHQFDCIAVENFVDKIAGIQLNTFYKKQAYFHNILGFDIIVWVPLEPENQ